MGCYVDASFRADLCLAPNINPKMTSCQLRISDIGQYRSYAPGRRQAFKLRYELRFIMDERRTGFDIIRLSTPYEASLA